MFGLNGIENVKAKIAKYKSNNINGKVLKIFFTIMPKKFFC